MAKKKAKKKASGLTDRERLGRSEAGRGYAQRGDRETAFQLGIPKDKFRMNREGGIVGASGMEESEAYARLQGSPSNTKEYKAAYKKYMKAALRKMKASNNRSRALRKGS